MQKTQKSPSILVLGNRHVLKFALASTAVKLAAEKYAYNAKYFEDFIEFNFANGQKNKVKNTFVNPANPPMRERDRFIGLYAKLKKYNTDELYDKLNLVQTTTNRNSPLETKWAYEYFKKYNSWKYKKDNLVTDQELLRPLDDDEVDLYRSMF
jgi:hypothetical protein